MKKKHLSFFKRYVLIFGFLNGLWLAIGFDPRTEVVGLIFRFQNFMTPWMIFLFGILPTLLFLFMLFQTYRNAKVFGIFAVLSAFIAGILILATPIISVFLLGLGYFLGKEGVKK